ncbi:MAG TPA: penicillin acylase family protein, partial [Myxococcota bacterium]|nr:penicillin acylase family protein [Myxococcota bacterium]
MRRSRALAMTLVVLSALAGLSCTASRFIGYTISPDAPDPRGSVVLPGLAQPVTVTYDRHHVPHIVAQTEADLWFAVGWVQARDRLFQMDMLRRMASGRVSELFGAQTAPDGMPFADTLGMDRFFRVMGLGQQAAASAARLGPESRALGDAYIAGINAWIRDAD